MKKIYWRILIYQHKLLLRIYKKEIKCVHKLIKIKVTLHVKILIKIRVSINKKNKILKKNVYIKKIKILHLTK
jgi:hypothetical protein